jgi:DNA-binding transcriptional LysR family regulator
VTVQRELAALRAQVSDLTGGRSGIVTLGATMIPGTHVLPGLLADFQAQHPDRQLVMRLLSPDAICGELLNGSVDLGIVSEAEPLPPALQAEPLWLDTDSLIAPPDHHVAGKPSVTLTDLVGEPFVVAWGRTLGDQTLDRALAAAGLPARRIVMALGSQDGVREAVLRGVGLAVVFHRVVAPDLRAGRLAALPLEGLAMAERHLLVYRQAHRLTPIATQLVTFLRREAPALSD